jgi:hypothetical protein
MYCFFLTATRFGIDKQIAEQNDFERLPFRSVETADECKELRNIVRMLASESEPDLNTLDEAVFDFYGIASWQRDYVTDTIRFDLDFLRHGRKAHGVLPAEQAEMRLYADTLVKFIRSNLAPGELTVNADVIIGLFDLRCVEIRFDEERNRGVRFTTAPEDNFSARLAELLHAPLASGVQLRRSLIHFDEDRCTIVKLAQKRFWSRARAYDDADSIFGELCRGGK